MRIISKDRDYYDSAMAHGQDLTAVFHRARLEIDIDLPENLKEAVKVGFHYPTQRNRLGEFFVFPFVIAFCGKLYRGIRVEERGTRRPEHDGVAGTPTHCFYDLDKYLAYCEQHKFNVAESLYFWQEDNLKKRLDAMKRFFGKQGSEEATSWLIEHKIVTMSIVHPYQERSTTRKEDAAFTINDTLKQFEFAKVFDPYAAYQEVDMFVSGTLPQSTVMPIDISDADRAKQHGFDKWSFRKMPETK